MSVWTAPDLLFSLHVPNLLQAICVISLTLLVFAIPPKLVSSAMFLHMSFSPLYRSLTKRLNRTRPAPLCRASDKGVGEAGLLPGRQPWHGEDAMQCNSPRWTPPTSGPSSFITTVCYEFPASFQVLRVWSHPSQHAVLCQVTL